MKIESGIAFVKRTMDEAELRLSGMPTNDTLEYRVAHLEYRMACLEYDAVTRFVHRATNNQQ